MGRGTTASEILYGQLPRSQAEAEAEQKQAQIELVANKYPKVEEDEFTADCPGRSGDYQFIYLLWEAEEDRDEEHYSDEASVVASFTSEKAAEAAADVCRKADEEAREKEEFFSFCIYHSQRNPSYQQGTPKRRTVYSWRFTTRYKAEEIIESELFEHDINDQTLTNYYLQKGENWFRVASTDKNIVEKAYHQHLEELGLNEDA